MKTMILYINHERDWRLQSFSVSKGTLDLERCQEADMVIEASDGKFRVIKNRYGKNEITLTIEEE